ncbi:MAG: hypothetical protein D6795_12470 [Deltaproteobacteria bacterium]|nr:MAG: hypothetical protein D6795_12470 [Deltaproteobacteria bacterium]
MPEKRKRSSSTEVDPIRSVFMVLMLERFPLRTFQTFTSNTNTIRPGTDLRSNERWARHPSCPIASIVPIDPGGRGKVREGAPRTPHPLRLPPSPLEGK